MSSVASPIETIPCGEDDTSPAITLKLSDPLKEEADRFTNHYMNLVHPNVPSELQNLPQWVTWMFGIRDGKPTKVPFAAYRYKNKDSGEWERPNAKPNDSSTWRSFSAATQQFIRRKSEPIQGIGFVFSPLDPLCGVDLDKCLDVEGRIKPWAQPYYDSLTPCYVEKSPSKTGLKFWVRAALIDPDGNVLDGVKGVGFGPDGSGAVEVYDRGRYFTVTGDLYGEDLPPRVDRRQYVIPDRSREVLDLYRIAEAKKEDNAEKRREAKGRPRKDVAGRPGPSRQPAGLSLDDDDRLAKAFASKTSGAVISALWSGDTSAHQNDDSSADLALANHLAFWFGPDESRVDRMFRQSRLMRDKWDERHGSLTYGQMTIGKALEGRTEFYGDGPKGSRGAEGGNAANGVADSEKAAFPSIEWSDATLIDVTDRTLKALGALNNPPEVFDFGGRFSWVKIDKEFGHAFVQQMDKHAVRNRLASAAIYKQTVETKKGSISKNTFPPMDAVYAVMAQKSWDDKVAPPLDLVVESPRFLRDGTLILSPGYHPEGRIYYQPPKSLLDLKLIENPSIQQVNQAVDLLTVQYLGDFPFADKASLANALACMLLPFVRLMIDGSTPLHLFEASTEGTGKGLCARACAYPSLGRALASRPQKENEGEWRKALTSALRGGPSHIFLDNLSNSSSWDGVMRPIDSGTLASFLTEQVWQDRILGGSKDATIKIQAVMMGAGNNVEWSKELSRRLVPSRLRTESENPSEKSGFKCDPLTLDQWAMIHRRELLEACLIICQHWIVGGKKPGKQVMGSYEAYAKVMGGILDTAGVPGFLDNIKVKKAGVDRESIRWTALVTEWSVREPTKPVTSGELHQMICGPGQPELQVAFADVLGEGSSLSQKQRLGHAMTKQIDRVWAGMRIVPSSIRGAGGAPTYKLLNPASVE